MAVGVYEGTIFSEARSKIGQKQFANCPICSCQLFNIRQFKFHIEDFHPEWVRHTPYASLKNCFNANLI